MTVIARWSHAPEPDRTKRSHLNSPGLILDTMQPIISQLDGKRYDSKAALRRTYKQAGVIEVGNDSSVTNPKPKSRPRVDRKAVSNIVDKAFAKAGFGA